MKYCIVAVAASATPVLATACDAIIGTEDRFFEGADATTPRADDGSLGDEPSPESADAQENDGSRGGDDGAPSASRDGASEASTDASSNDAGADGDDASVDANPTSCAEAGACPLPMPLVEFHTVDPPITDFGVDGPHGSYLYVAVSTVGLYAVKKSDPDSFFLYWTNDGDHTLLAIQATAETVYMLETEDTSGEQYLYSCPSLTGQSPSPCTQSAAIMTLDKAAGMQIVGSEISWYGNNLAWQGTLQQNGTGTSVNASFPVGIDVGPANLYVASTNGLYRFPTATFGGSSFVDTNSAVAANSVASDAMHVYGANAATSSIYEMTAMFASGAEAPNVIASAQANPVSLQIDGSTLYWLNQGSSGSSNGAVMSCPAPDCNPPALPVVVQQLNQPMTMRVETGDAFYVQDVVGSGTSARQVIYRLPQ